MTRDNIFRKKKSAALSVIILIFALSLSSCTNMYDPETDDYLYAGSTSEASAENGSASGSEASQASSSCSWESDASHESSQVSSSEESMSSSTENSQSASSEGSLESSSQASQPGELALTAEEIQNQIDAIDGYHAPKNWQKLYPHGSSDKLSGTIAVVSIFVNDGNTTWDFDREEDFKAYSRAYWNLKYATEYLTQQSANYGQEVNFIWDWMDCHRLYYVATLDVQYDDVLTENGKLSDAMWDFIDNNVNSEGIRQVFDADSVIYMAYLNSPEGNRQPSCTRDFYDWMPYPYEICYMQMHNKEGLSVPAVFAHEMLHTFGAPDIYYTESYSAFSLDYGITQEFTEYAASTNLNDIMRITWDPKTNKYLPTSIAQDITEITAYYVGLIDHSDLVDEWGFDPSDHVSR